MENAIVQRYKPTFDDGLTKDQRYYRRHRKERNIRNISNKTSNKQYYQEHKDYWKNFAKNRDKEKHLEICAKWRKNNKEKIKLWRGRNKLSLKRHSHNRRIKIYSLGNLSTQIIQQVYEDNIKQYGTLTCYLCLKPIEFGQDSLEHKIPLCRGGTNEYNNLAIAHRKCNSRKHSKTYEEFIKNLK